MSRRRSTATRVSATEVRRRRHLLRNTAIGLATSVTLFGVAGVPTIAAAATNSPTSSRATATLTDWSGGGWYGQSDSGSTGGQSWGDPWGDGSSGDGSSGSSTGTATVDSQAATVAQSKGVVLIDTVLSYEDAEGAGTGMVLTSSGLILTNYHVVEGATKITVTIASTGKTYRATVVGHDATHDIALLQLKNASGLTTATLDDDSVAVGDDVTAVGNAGGTGALTAADGSVTSLSATVTTAAEGSVASETLKSMIETSADVVAGDSGGPLYDADGEVIGIDTAASTGSEIDGYAIPIDEALKVVDQIRSGDATATVKIGPAAFLGVLVSEDSSATYGQNSAYGLGGWGSSDGLDTDSEGATISGVVDGSPAAKARLAEGDVITRIGTHTVTSADQVSTLIAKHAVGDKIKITWTDTDGATHTQTVTLAASPVA